MTMLLDLDFPNNVENTSIKVLLIEDDEDDYLITEDTLEDIPGQDYELTWVSEFDRAVDAIETFNDYDVVLVDFYIGKSTGLELLHLAREKDVRSPIIMLTGVSDRDIDSQVIQAGASDYLVKGKFNEDSLERAIRYSIDRKKNEAALRRSEAQQRQKAKELQQALDDLRRTQTQLIQSEKMASLGQMVAGIAHEINNPISFIFGNIGCAEEYMRDLLDIIDLYQNGDSNSEAAIAEKLEDVDLDYIKTDFPQLLDSVKEGADRVRKIVLSLRSFARLDEAEVKTVRVNDCIESTVIMLSSRLAKQAKRDAIELITILSNLPNIECYPGQLNQALLNIFNNAIDALELRCKQEPDFVPRLTITSKKADPAPEDDREWIQIEIADNGLGIPDDAIEKIFDPFFTTKPVGKGKGLGLSIAYQIIVDRHGGELACRSLPGQGATFYIRLPVQLKRE